MSAGYSSVMMAVMLPKWFPDHNIVYAMANTSKEHDESLDFMNDCDKHFGLNMAWVEAVINQESGIGTGFRIVEYEDIKRSGEIFETGIKKYGIPNSANKWCNREMKLVPLKKFCDSIFDGSNYSIAVGLRADEIDRVSGDYKTNNIFYPLIENNIGARERNKFWKDQPIQIKIPAYKGNCDLCFEKSNRKLMTLLSEEPGRAEWWGRMVKTYGSIPLEGKPSYNDLMEQNGGVQTFYREYKTIEDLVRIAQTPFVKATDEYIYENDLFDFEDECGSGCHAF